MVCCGCYTVRNYAKVNTKGLWGRGHGGGSKSLCCKRRSTQCRISSMKVVQPTLNDGTQAIQGLPGLNLKNFSESPISLAQLFDVVADDLQTLNKNLQSVSHAFRIHAYSVLFFLFVFADY
ncbi:hypothetical protein RIF29_30132 [Crotalaria pallida]|uniref:Uncharacterized protein n=1 Tax=Crotalaria pallida TaxID=3830 RepID=A0AAN9I115_CROPI